MFCTFILLLSVFCQEIALFTIHPELEFWTRGSDIAARRANAIKETKNLTNKENKNQIRFNKVKGPTTEENKIKHAEEKAMPKPTVQYHTNDRKREYAADKLDKKKQSWPKIEAPIFRNKKKDVLRSTRMTPIYLMQHEDDEASTKAHEEKEDDRILTPYTLKQDLLELSHKFPEANITIEVIKRTVEYNDIILLKVSERRSEISKYFRADESKYVDEVPEKKIIFIVHGLSIMGMDLVPCLKQITKFRELLSYYFAHLDKFDIFLMPMANPDGATLFRDLWNKNTSPQGACSGVALDRNFDVSWNQSNMVSSCSQQYPGPTPFSEPETRAIREVLHQYSHKIHAYFHVHAGTYTYSSFKGDAVLYPKGYTDIQSDDDKYIDLHGEIDEAMKNASFQVLSVTVDTLHNWYGKISGSSVDYASSVYGIPYALELVMQPYDDSEGSKTSTFSTHALREIWKRIIDVIFTNIWRNTKNNEVK